MWPKLLYVFYFFFIESLEGQVVWITGASSGIGKALAIRLAKAKARVVLSARSVENLNEVKQQCIGKYINFQPSFFTFRERIDIIIITVIDILVDRHVFHSKNAWKHSLSVIIHHCQHCHYYCHCYHHCHNFHACISCSYS